MVRTERTPRETLMREGARALTDEELLATLLGTGVAGQPAQALARELLAPSGLRGLLDREPGALVALRGIGPARAARLLAALDLGRRHLEQSLAPGETLTCPAATRRFLSGRLRHLRYEVFACLFLDTQHRVLGFEELFRGTIDGASVYPREVVAECLARNAAAVILAHNHPSGVAEPSLADRQITRRLCDALSLVDIRVLDHVVVGDGQAVSFAERGLL